MAQSWRTFEERIRSLASHIWGRPCQKARIGGVDIDGEIRLGYEASYLIEMTEERNLGKVRNDVIKLTTAKNALIAKGIFARCYCVINGSVTDSMIEAGRSAKVNVLSIEDFSKIFFDFDRYHHARSNSPFGSAVNPLTGEQDETKYVSVNYFIEGTSKEVSARDIGDWVRNGQKVILLGEYGSGKSRCLWEVFRYLTTNAHENFCYPIAIDLRKAWGLIRGVELLRRHFEDLGLDDLESNAVRAYNVGSVVALVDGFDEIGSQAWSDDVLRLKAIRMKALEGVRDLIKNGKSGALITGREHYFPNHSEMFSALGVDASQVVVLRSKDEFSDTELSEYFSTRELDLDIPSWLPRRPLICQTISDLAADQFEIMFGDEGGEVAFWNHFIKVLCERDARIHPSFDTDTIFRLFVNLARLTRTKTADVGPISLAELQQAFEQTVGRMPVEEASVMLQRLPSLGRIGADSNDRQFVDVYILDGLRAKDVIDLCSSDEDTLGAACAASWINPLDDLGQRILRSDSKVGVPRMLDVATKALTAKNKVLASDIVGAMIRAPGDLIDFRGLAVDQGNFLRLDLRERRISNLTIKNSIFSTLYFPSPGSSNLRIEGCVASRIAGISSATALPAWAGVQADKFDSVESVSRIKRIGLSPAHEILTTIIRKTFFQKGSGRKEEALLRGLGRIGAKGLTDKVLNVLLREGILEKFRGDEGWVYAPVRANAARMQKLLDELRSSKDALWMEIGQF